MRGSKLSEFAEDVTVERGSGFYPEFGSDLVRRLQTPTRSWKLNWLLGRNRRARLGGKKLDGIGMKLLRLGLPHTECRLRVDPTDHPMLLSIDLCSPSSLRLCQRLLAFERPLSDGDQDS